MIGKMEHQTSKCIARTWGIAASVAFGLMSLTPLPSWAQTYSVLHSFTGEPNDGAYGTGNLLLDDAGNLYGTTSNGGAYDQGTAFKVDAAGSETVLTTFDYANGVTPSEGLILHKGILYDTVNGGGYDGAGAVIKINDRGKATLLYSFCPLANCPDGMFPQYGVTRDSAGNLYGTTNGGGAYGAGIVFKVAPGGNETVLYSFCPGGGNCSGGGYPLGSGTIRDSAGNLYGYAQGGPNTDCGGGQYTCGVVWKLDASGNETVLHAFTGPPSDGYLPQGLLTADGAGNQYGITSAGGSGTACGQNYGCGTVFKIGANGNETVLYNFTGGADGAAPNSEALVLDKKGNLYGTALSGGAYGYGTVFKLSASGKLKVLYAFHGQSDGGIPVAGLLLKQGVLYGEADIGGNLNCSENPGGGCGVVFKITNP